MSRLLAKHWAIALVVSLALNLFLGGIFAARWLGGPRGGPRSGKPHLRFDALREALGPEAKAAIDQVDGKHSAAIRETMGEMMAARRAATEALTADPFDADKAREAHRSLIAKETAARGAMHEALVELAAALPAEQRAKLGKAMSRRGKRGRHGRGRSHRDGDDGRKPGPDGSAQTPAE
jgi:uncharacterized membrane protein